MSLVTKRNVLLAREESSYGVDPTPAAATHAILALDLSVTPQGDKLERTPGMATLSRLNPIIGKRWVEITFGVEIRGSGTAGVAPRLGDLLEACGKDETVVADTSVAYNPASSSHKSVTLYCYLDGYCWKVTGCGGNVELVGDINAIGRLNFSFMGLYTDPVDEALPSGMVYDPAPEPLLSAGFSYDSIDTLKIANFQANLQNEIAPSEDVNHANGVSAHTITGRNVIGSFNPEMVSKATYDFYSKWKSANAAALDIKFGQTAGKILTVTAPKVTMDSVTPGDRGGIRIFDVPLSFGMDSGNDELILTFT